MMAFQNFFIVSVIHKDKPLREFSDNGSRVVKIPFDSEYKLRLKSKSPKRAMVSVEIDGTDVLCGKQLILGAHDTFDLERFVDSLSNGKKFKFVPLSNSQVQDPTSHDNGKIKVTFYPEKEIPFIGGCFNVGVAGGQFNNSGIVRGGSTSFSSFTTTGSSPGPYDGTITTACVNSTPTQATNGATVEGGHSSQEFNLSQGFITEGSVQIEIWMRGAEPVIHHKGYYVKVAGGTTSLYAKDKLISGASVVEIKHDTLYFKVNNTMFTTRDFSVGFE